MNSITFTTCGDGFIVGDKIEVTTYSTIWPLRWFPRRAQTLLLRVIHCLTTYEVVEILRFRPTIGHYTVGETINFTTITL